MRKFFSDFKEFITKGNIIDLAIAVVIGGAFGKIVTSLVNDIIMPLISMTVGGVSVVDWKWVIKEAVYDSGVLVEAENALYYGIFVQTVLDFLIISFFVFAVLRLLMKAKSTMSAVKDKATELSKKQIKKLSKQGLSKQEIAEIQENAKKDAEVVAEAPKLTTSEELLTEIRNLLVLQTKPADSNEEQK